MTQIPEGYHAVLSLYDTQRAIERIKHIFLAKLCAALHLVRVTAPLVVEAGANVLVAGSAVYGKEDIPAAIASLRCQG